MAVAVNVFAARCEPKRYGLSPSKVRPFTLFAPSFLPASADTHWPLAKNPCKNYSLYTSWQMEAQQKPEGLKRRRWCVPIVQAGVKPLQKRTVTLAPKGRQNVLPPLRVLAIYRLFTGVSPLPVVSTPLRGYPSEMCIKSSIGRGANP